MTVSIEPLAIGSLDGPRVWIVIRQVGGHKDIQEAPDGIVSEIGAVHWAAAWWGVRTGDVRVLPVQVVEINRDDQ